MCLYISISLKRNGWGYLLLEPKRALIKFKMPNTKYIKRNANAWQLPIFICRAILGFTKVDF